MHLKAPLILIATICVFSQGYTQPRCGFDGKMDELRRDNPNIDALVNRQVQEFKNTQQKTTTLATLYYIPVVVHIVHTGGAVGSLYNPTDATIISTINYLNSVYDGTWNGAGGSILGAGDIQIKFVLATKDPNNNPTTGINHIDGSGVDFYSASGVRYSTVGADELNVKNIIRWDPTRYYNIWVVNKIDGQDGTGSSSFIGGYATFPWVNNSTSSSLKKDGVVMLATQMFAGAKTLPHEIGHAFGLYHPFQGETNVTGALNSCPSNGNPLTDGDCCADTDPIINPADDGYGTSAFNCRTGFNSCSGGNFNENTEKNFMNYTTCYRLFTNDQKTRMLGTATNSTRSGLASSWANNQGSYPITWQAPVPAAVTPVTAGNYPNAVGVMSVNMNGMTIYSLNATQDEGYVNNVKWYNLFQVYPNTNYTMNIGLNNSGFYEQVGVWIDYDGNGSFNDANERVFYNNTIASTTSLAINFTTPAALSGSIVRMRIVSDYSTAYGMPQVLGNSTSIYAGQAEDYPVYLKSTSVLPLKLVKFVGQTINHVNLLQWITTEESNSKEFQVERSLNGEPFEIVGTVQAKGNTTTETTYRFNDNADAPGSYVYRLKMVDIDDHFTYSQSISLKIQEPVNFEIVGNPFHNTIKVRCAQNVALSLRLMDITGRTLEQMNLSQTSGSIVEMKVNPSLTSGVYLLESVVNNQKTVYKLVKE